MTCNDDGNCGVKSGRLAGHGWHMGYRGFDNDGNAARVAFKQMGCQIGSVLINDQQLI